MPATLGAASAWRSDDMAEIDKMKVYQLAKTGS